MDNLVIVQINLHHCSDANDALSSYAESSGVHFFLCQDPYISGGVFAGLPPDWVCFYSSSFSSVILATNKAFAIVKGLVTHNAVFITLTLKIGPLILGSVYAPPLGNLDNDLSWINYYHNCTRIVVGGDFNVPLKMLGYSREDGRTETFTEYLMTTDLRMVNDCDAPHSYVQDDRTGRPDLTLLGVDTVPYLQEWKVDDRVFSFSDHRYIIFSLCLSPIYRTYNRFKTKNKSMYRFNRNFSEQYDLLYTSLKRVFDQSSLEEWTENFNDYLQTTMSKSFRR